MEDNITIEMIFNKERYAQKAMIDNKVPKQNMIAYVDELIDNIKISMLLRIEYELYPDRFITPNPNDPTFIVRKGILP